MGLGDPMFGGALGKKILRVLGEGAILGGGEEGEKGGGEWGKGLVGWLVGWLVGYQLLMSLDKL